MVQAFWSYWSFLYKSVNDRSNVSVASSGCVVVLLMYTSIYDIGFVLLLDPEYDLWPALAQRIFSFGGLCQCGGLEWVWEIVCFGRVSVAALCLFRRSPRVRTFTGSWAPAHPAASPLAQSSSPASRSGSTLPLRRPPVSILLKNVVRTQGGRFSVTKRNSCLSHE